MKLAQLKTETVAIWGFGVEGKATLHYLRQKLPDLQLTILCPSDEAEPLDEPSNYHFCHQPITAELLSRFTVVIKSPGISPYQAAVADCTANIISGSSLWFANQRQCSNAKIIAITGTKGKSTTAAMLTHILSELDYKVVLAGNFGTPLLQCLDDYDYIILETSSYQAQDGSIQADCAVLLNLYQEHLDWHGSERQYHLDKWRLLQNAKHSIISAGDKSSQQMQQQFPLSEFSQFNQNNGFYVLNNSLMYQYQALLSTHGWQLKGKHNLANAAAVCQVLTVLGLPVGRAINALRDFKPLPHRLQTVANIAGVSYIDDSIASTPKATLAALQTVNLSKTWLLIGGFDRDLDWQDFIDFCQNQHLKGILCSGQNGAKIHQMLTKVTKNSDLQVFKELVDAVAYACQNAQSGDTVLLSPGAASFDAFANYQQRGVQFAKWIKQSN